ncbi:hypothetical protein Dtox_1362 [Desulfofarcimen acetoxidans DSM 771]|uniref:TIGR04086 family membrane protein n=1 Tax=Desulfofarcimen acetoxidans (strain ATCC 49208 / DSM 771 / KCTC 5769 / VKM B-1644 / 5575) TaxID=485916 RepID=C8W6E9_DESAS|nr:TIGR04086 family membrane protein [Desulfofarcimen acetoxidans]ACV62238.1 hypothetical protein Dtox_1362 [Desulfofarcimen acetoxidans DSM 771]
MSFNQDSAAFIQITAVLKSTLVALMFSTVLIALLGLIIYYSDISETTIPWISAGIIFLSVTCGGLFAGKMSGTKGLLHGLSVGILFFLIIWLASALILPGHILLLSSLHKLLLSLTSGALGGVLGVGSA